MAITQTMTTSFKVELLQGVHSFGPTSPDTFKIALYASTATLNASTALYSTVGELPTAGGYTQGGVALTISVSPTSGGTTAYISFSNPAWINATFTAAGALIYNYTEGNKSVAVLDFGGNKTITNGTFVVQFPTAAGNTAIIRIA